MNVPIGAVTFQNDGAVAGKLNGQLAAFPLIFDAVAPGAVIGHPNVGGVHCGKKIGHHGGEPRPSIAR